MDRKYKSKNTGNMCGIAQYMAELMCERMALNKGIGSLPPKFWNLKEWKKPYQLQIMRANALLKVYDEQVILNALNSKKGKSIYSLHAAWLNDILVEEEILFNRKNKSLEELKVLEFRETNDSKPRVPFGNEGKASKLRRLDG